MEPVKSRAIRGGGTRLAMRTIVALALSGLSTSPPLCAQTVGQPVAALDSGCPRHPSDQNRASNVALLIFPDGTSLLVDAGDSNPEPPRGATRAPDGSRTPGEWIARYARRMLTRDPDPAIDYAFSTHFHGDHMGWALPGVETLRLGRLQVDGLHRCFRAHPDPHDARSRMAGLRLPRRLDNPMMDNYRAFLEAQRARHGMKVERLRPGRSDQIVLKREPDRYTSFEVRNIAANGESEGVHRGAVLAALNLESRAQNAHSNPTSGVILSLKPLSSRLKSRFTSMRRLSTTFSLNPTEPLNKL